jgi:hypothetical protein
MLWYVFAARCVISGQSVLFVARTTDLLQSLDKIQRQSDLPAGLLDVACVRNDEDARVIEGIVRDSLKGHDNSWKPFTMSKRRVHNTFDYIRKEFTSSLYM